MFISSIETPIKKEEATLRQLSISHKINDDLNFYLIQLDGYKMFSSLFIFQMSWFYGPPFFIAMKKHLICRFNAAAAATISAVATITALI